MAAALELPDLFFELLLIGDLFLLEVSDDAKLMFLEDFVVFVHLRVLLLDLASTVLKLDFSASGTFQLSLDFVEPLVLRSPLPSEFV